MKGEWLTVGETNGGPTRGGACRFRRADIIGIAAEGNRVTFLFRGGGQWTCTFETGAIADDAYLASTRILEQP